MPCHDEDWALQTEQEWLQCHHIPTEDVAPRLSCATVLTQLLSRRPPSDKLSGYGMLILAATLLLHVLTWERTTLLTSENSGHSGEVERMEEVLKVYETCWHSHPEARTHALEYVTRPLLADCVPLLSLAYYHTYASCKLKLLKRSLRAASTHDSITGQDLKTISALLQPASGIELEYLRRAARIAALAIYRRAKLGFTYVARTAPLKMGFHYVFAAFEAGQFLLLSRDQILTAPSNLAVDVDVYGSAGGHLGSK